VVCVRAWRAPSTTSTSVAVGSSFPSTTGWVGTLNNVSGATTTFDVVAVCARAPRLYQVVLIAPLTARANSQAGGTATCPAGTVVLGGGSIANTSSVAVNINSTLPSGKSWHVDLNNNTVPDTTFDVLAICGKRPRGYAIVAGSTVTNPAFEQTIATVTCPAGTVPLSGGAFSASSSPAVNLDSSTPTSNGWDVFENNGRTGDTTLTAVAVCSG
jgi:hypothetical protein